MSVGRNNPHRRERIRRERGAIEAAVRLGAPLKIEPGKNGTRIVTCEFNGRAIILARFHRNINWQLLGPLRSARKNMGWFYAAIEVEQRKNAVANGWVKTSLGYVPVFR